MNRTISRSVSVWFTLIALFVFSLTAGSARADSIGQKPDPNTAPAVQKENPNGLWLQVNTCIQNAITKAFMPNPWPVLPLPTPTCVYIEPEGLYANIGDGFAILKAKDSHIYHFLTIPTKAITGIEDPQVNFFRTNTEVNTSYSPNYWPSAWQWLGGTVGKIFADKKKRALTPDQMGLAINSPQVRSQNQLHIHMACINKAVQTALAGVKPPISTCTKLPCTWSKPIAIPIKNKSTVSYRAVVLSSLSLNPFLVMKSIPANPDKATVIITAKPRMAQYYLLEDEVNGFGERLLDADCATQ